MGGGGGRLVLAVAVRSLRQQRSAVIPASSHALHLLESRLCIGQPWNSEICIDQGSISKNSSETWAFAAAGVMAYSQATTTKAAAPTVLEKVQQSGSGEKSSLPTSKGKPKVVFVLGGPGSGKGTQCQKIVDNYGFVHLSAGDLLRAEINSGSEKGQRQESQSQDKPTQVGFGVGAMIQNMIKEGKIVPSEVTVKLLLKAMQDSNSEKFLIDGFPRNDENRQVFERLTGITPEFILFFDCPEDEMQRRVLGRNQGREDDNKETMQKRLKVFADYSVPVVNSYEATGKVRKIIATGSVDDIFSNIQPLFKSFVHKEHEQERTQPITQQSAQKSSEQSKSGNPALN